MTDHEPTPSPKPGGPLDGSQEPSALGASASLPAEKKRRRGSRGDGDGRSRLPSLASIPKPAGRRGAALLVAAVVLLACVPLVASGLKKTPKDKIGISYGGGPIEGAHFQRIVQPGSTLFFNGFFDPLYLYPDDQQNYIVSKVPQQGSTQKSDSIVAPSSDRVQVSYQVAVYFKLNTGLLRPFHEQFGLKYVAYTKGGWNSLLQDTFRQQIENALQEQTRRYAVSDIYGNAQLLLKIQTQVQKTLSQRLVLAMGKKYFCAPTFAPGRPCDDPIFIIKAADIPSSVVSAFNSNRTSQILIQTKTNEVAQRQEEAQGIDALNAAIGQSGSFYTTLKAIESGKINFWVIPSETGLTLAAPSGSTPGPGAPPPTTTAPPTTAPPTTTTTTPSKGAGQGAGGGSGSTGSGPSGNGSGSGGSSASGNGSGSTGN